MFETKMDYEFAETIINCLPELVRKKEQKFVRVGYHSSHMEVLENMQKEGYLYRSYIPIGNDEEKILVFEK